MRKIKLLHYVYNLNQGGAETLVKDYALLIDKDQFDIVILCHDRIGSPYEKILEDANIRVIYISDYIPFKKFYANPIVKKIICHSYLDKLIAKHIIKKENPDIVHAHMFCNDLIKFTNIPQTCKLFYTVHSQPKAYWCNKKRFAQRDFKALSYLINKHSMRLIALNESMRVELNEMFHVNNTVVLNNGIDFKRFNVEESKKSIRKSLGIEENNFLVGHVGRFVPVKNHELIVDSFNELSKIRDNAHLLLVGTGELRLQIEAKIKALKLEDKVTILDSRTDIPRIMKSLDVFMFPSHFEGLGIVLIEAQKMGVSCVISSAIPEAAVVSNLVHRMEKNAPAKEWAEQLNKIETIEPQYFGIEKWDMNVVIKQLEEMYLREISTI